jgi:hypothetical protein
MNYFINDSDVGYFWDDQWNVPSDGKGDKAAEKSSTAHKKEDDPKGSR